MIKNKVRNDEERKMEKITSRQWTSRMRKLHRGCAGRGRKFRNLRMCLRKNLKDSGQPLMLSY